MANKFMGIKEEEKILTNLERAKKLLSWAGKNRKYLILSMLFGLISGILTVVPYYTVFKVIELVYTQKMDINLILKYISLLFAAIVGKNILFNISGILSHKGAYSTLYDVRCMITGHMSKVPLGYLNKKSTGEIKVLLNEEIEKLEIFLAHSIPEIVIYIGGIFSVFFYLCITNLSLSLLTLIPFVVAMGIMMLMFKGAGAMMQRMGLALMNLNTGIIEYINGMRLIKAFNMGSHSFSKFKDSVDEEHACWVEMSKKMAPIYAVYTIVIECGIILMIPIGGVWFLSGKISLSTFILFAYVGSLYLTEMRPLQELGANLVKVLNVVEKCQKFMEIPVYQSNQKMPDKYDIEIRNASFSYNEGAAVVKNVSLSIKEEQTIAIVGKSGSGKSTLAQLISRFYDLGEGEILIGGRNIRQINYEELLNNISIVFQNSFLTTGSVYENIAMGEETTLEKVREAAKKAQIDNFIMGLPDGYNTNVGSYGSRFSGGEKQRIAIARAFFKNAPIVILDEATSAADPENQREVDSAIDKLCKDKTVIMIAHRLDVALKADLVAVMDKGEIVNIGKHQEVLEKNSYYQNAWDNYIKANEIIYGFEMEVR